MIFTIDSGSLAFGAALALAHTLPRILSDSQALYSEKQKFRIIPSLILIHLTVIPQKTGLSFLFAAIDIVLSCKKQKGQPISVLYSNTFTSAVLFRATLPLSFAPIDVVLSRKKQRK